ncbi:hypothetical protein LINGRAHAP2_LOCUS22088 [Linum grandiflorum]
MGAGVMIQDDTGKLLLAAVMKQQGVWQPLHAEAAAVEFGVQFGEFQGISEGGSGEWRPII